MINRLEITVDLNLQRIGFGEKSPFVDLAISCLYWTSKPYHLVSFKMWPAGKVKQNVTARYAHRCPCIWLYL